MHHSQASRNEHLGTFKRLLGTPDGELLMEELVTVWDSFGILGETDQVTAYNCGLRDAYKFLLQLKDGDLINDG